MDKRKTHIKSLWWISTTSELFKSKTKAHSLMCIFAFGLTLIHTPKKLQYNFSWTAKQQKQIVLQNQIFERSVGVRIQLDLFKYNKMPNIIFCSSYYSYHSRYQLIQLHSITQQHLGFYDYTIILHKHQLQISSMSECLVIYSWMFDLRTFYHSNLMPFIIQNKPVYW